MPYKVELDGVEVYSPFGLIHCSVCQPEDMQIEEMLEIVNRINPTGLDHGWKVSDEENFASGRSNPCNCEIHPGKIHRLLVC